MNSLCGNFTIIVFGSDPTVLDYDLRYFVFTLDLLFIN